MESTKIFMAERGRHGRVIRIAYNITTTPHELTASEKASRWMPEFGHLITKVERVKIGTLFGLVPADVVDVDWSSQYIVWQTYTVITTDFGQCCVVEYENGHEVSGLVFHHAGRKPESRTLGTWRKYGGKRGHGMQWLRAMAAQGLCKSPESGRDICCAEAYDRMAGGTKFAAA